MKLDTATLEAEGIRVGQVLTDEELHELVQKSEAHRAHEKALYLLEYRSRSRKELKDRLRREVGDETAENTVSHMEELGLVDDEAYARQLAHNLAQSKRFAPRRIRQELAARGIDRDVAEEAAQSARTRCFFGDRGDSRPPLPLYTGRKDPPPRRERAASAGIWI